MKKSMTIKASPKAILILSLAICLLAVLTVSSYALKGESKRSEVFLVTIKGSINPGTEELFKRAIKEASTAEASMLVVRLDTPGGLVSTLRNIVQEIMSSPVPVTVFVAPSGAQAASAGAILTMAAHVAAMAPGTNIGAAHPVTIGDSGKKEKDDNSIMKEKAENDLAAMARSIAEERGRNSKWAEDAVRKSVSATAREALELGVIDIIATDVDDLLSKLDNRKISLQDRKVTLSLKDPYIVVIKETFRERVLRTIGDPNIAYILMMIGLTGLYFEFAHPGMIFPGTIGAICLLLSLFALQTLPVNTVGILLILLAIVLFVLELVVTSYGILGAAGLLSLMFGSLMLFDTAKTGISIAAWVLWPTFLGVGTFLSVIVWLATMASLSKPRAGAEAMIGEEGVAQTDIDSSGGKVFLHGEIWNAESDTPIKKGSHVTVIDIKGLKLRVSSQGG